MARRTRTKKVSGGIKANLTGPTSPEQPQIAAVGKDPESGEAEQPKAAAAMALSGPTSPEQPQ
jgi:hypothetical protein